jgi:hypothetical protein
MPNERDRRVRWSGPYRQSQFADTPELFDRLRAGITGGTCLLICLALCTVGGLSAVLVGVNHAAGYSALANFSLPPGSALKTTPPPQPTPVHQATIFIPEVLRTALTCDEAVNNSHARICVHTRAGTALQITISYCSGAVDQSPSLQGTHNADANGDFEWDWTPHSTCAGQALARIIAQLDGFDDSDLTYPFTLQPGAGGPTGTPSPSPTRGATGTPTPTPAGATPTPTPAGGPGKPTPTPTATPAPAPTATPTPTLPPLPIP